MTAKKDPKDGKIKTPKMIHLPPEIAQQLEEAAEAAHISQSVYVMLALKAQFRKDGIR
jgi:hypothetical protein